MSDDHPNPSGRLSSWIPEYVKLGLAVLVFLYSVAILTDIVDPIPSNVMAVVWGAVSIYLIVRAVRLSRES